MGDSLVDSLISWTTAVFVPLGIPGLFIIAFAEASFFPVPPDIVLIALVLYDPANALLYGAVTTVGSVLGALLGYLIGLKGGRPVAVKIVGENKIRRAEDYFNRFGAWVVGIAAFTPIPYKVFTITSGTLRLRDLKGFVIASILGRGARFFAEAVTIMLYGETIIGFLRVYFEQLTIVAAAVIVIFYIAYQKMRKRKQEEGSV